MNKAENREITARNAESPVKNAPLSGAERIKIRRKNPGNVTFAYFDDLYKNLYCFIL